MLGARIGIDPDGHLMVPNRPVIPVVRGAEWAAHATVDVRKRIDDAVLSAYGGRRSIQWLECIAGEPSMRALRTPVPDETVEAIRVHRVALVGPLPTVDGDARTLESELVEILDLHLGFSLLGEGDTTLLCWENRETCAAGLALEEGGSDSAAVSSALSAARQQAASEPGAPGWALSVSSRHAARRLAAAGVQCARSFGAASDVAVLEAEGGGEAVFTRWLVESTPEPIRAVSVSSALATLLQGRPLPSALLSNATNATHLVRLALATSQGGLACARSHPETGHCVIGPLGNDVSADDAGRAMAAAGLLLLRHLGWSEAAQAFVDAGLAKAS